MGGLAEGIEEVSPPAGRCLLLLPPGVDFVCSFLALGVQDIAFNRKSGLEVSEMVRSAWVFRRLRDFRSGIGSCISTLKRAFQMGRCTWRGLPSFRAYVWSCVTSFNLIALARHLLAREFA